MASRMTAHEPISLASVPQPYRFSQGDYILLSERGAFNKVGKTELIDGVIFAVNAQHSRHVRVQSLLFRTLADACDGLKNGLSAWIDGSLSIDDSNMPQPDIFVSRGLPDNGPMTLDRFALAVEVSDTTLKFDLNTKSGIYAAAGIAEYWVADVEHRVVHQFWSPNADGFQEKRETAFGELLTAATIPGLSVDTTALL